MWLKWPPIKRKRVAPYGRYLTPELDTILGMALGTPKAVGVEVTIFNPRLDHDGTIARSLVDALVRSLTK